jgi:broad specificity phosphatase PhoE
MADRLFIVRHGETEWSRSGQHTSHTDLPLTRHGVEQGEVVSGKLSGEAFEMVLCSPLARARETCRLAGFADAAEPCEDLHEWDYGDYEGLTTPQIRQRRPDWWLWRDGCPNGESPEETGDRLDRVLERFAAVEGDVLAFAHGHSLRVLTARWLGLPVATGAHFKLAAAAIGVLGHERATPTIDRWSA